MAPYFKELISCAAFLTDSTFPLKSSAKASFHWKLILVPARSICLFLEVYTLRVGSLYKVLPVPGQGSIGYELFCWMKWMKVESHLSPQLPLALVAPHMPSISTVTDRRDSLTGINSLICIITEPVSLFFPNIIFVFIVWEFHTVYPSHIHFPFLPCVPLNCSSILIHSLLKILKEVSIQNAYVLPRLHCESQKHFIFFSLKLLLWIRHCCYDGSYSRFKTTVCFISRWSSKSIL